MVTTLTVTSVAIVQTPREDVGLLEMMACPGRSAQQRQRVSAELVFRRRKWGDWEEAPLVFQSLRDMTQLVLRPLKVMNQPMPEALREIGSWCLHCFLLLEVERPEWKMDMGPWFSLAFK